MLEKWLATARELVGRDPIPWIDSDPFESFASFGGPFVATSLGQQPAWDLLELETHVKDAHPLAAKFTALWYLHEAIKCLKEEQDEEREEEQRELESKVDSFLGGPLHCQKRRS
jgi:hypothetical protein